jgi:hypothetical protein
VRRAHRWADRTNLTRRSQNCGHSRFPESSSVSGAGWSRRGFRTRAWPFGHAVRSSGFRREGFLRAVRRVAASVAAWLIGMTADVQTQDVLISAAIFSRSTYSSRASGARTIQRVRSVRGRARPRPPHGWTVGPDSHGLDGGKLINGMPRGVAALSGRLYRGPARWLCPSRGTQRAHRLPCVSSSGPGRRQRTSSSRTRQGCRGNSPRGTVRLSCPPYPRCRSRTGAWASAARHAARGRVR